VAVSSAVTVLRTAASVIAPATTIAAAATRGILHSRAEIAADTRLERLLRRRWQTFGRNRAAILTLRRDRFRTVCVFVLVFRFRRRDHAFFFGSRLFLFQLRVLRIFRVFFAFVFLGMVIAVVGVILMQAGLSCFRASVSSRKHALLRIARRVVILSIRDVLGERRRFLFRQIHVRMFFVMRDFVMASFMMLAHFGSIAQFEIRAERLHLIPVARILRPRLFHMRVRCWHGIHFRSRRHQRRKWRETNRVRNRRVILLLRPVLVVRLRLRSHGLGRKMRMRFPLRERFSREWFQPAAR